MEKEVDVEEMEKIVREAGLYEENMPEETIKDYYKALANSKDTAASDDEFRRLNKNEEDVSISLGFENSKPVMKKSSQKSTDEDVPQGAAQDATEANIEYSDMPKCEEEPFKIFSHVMKFLNIQSSGSFLNANVNEKSKMLYSYHTTVGKLQAQLSRTSYFPVPMPKPIIITTDDSAPLETDFFVSEDTYISRSGRQTKRKIYNEDDENSLDSDFNKKQKNDEESEVKKLKKIPKKLESSQETVVSKKNVESSASATKINKLTNDEIMRRSSIFSNSPKSKPKSARCELMFDKLKEESLKKMKEEKENEAFEKTLKNSEDVFQDDDQVEKEEIISITQDEHVRKRVVPPVGRRGIHQKVKQASKVLKENGKDITKEIRDATGDEIMTPRTRQKPKVKTSVKNEASSNTHPCPICGDSFPAKAIMEHASSCGDVEVETPKYSVQQTLTCQICEKVVLSNFEAHVKDCIGRQTE